MTNYGINDPVVFALFVVSVLVIGGALTSVAALVITSALNKRHHI